MGQWKEQTDYGASSGSAGSGGLALLGQSCVTYQSDIYCVGGQTAAGQDISDVFYAAVSASGAIGKWTETTDYGATSGTSGSGGVGIEWPSCVQNSGIIYCVGGATSNTPYILSTVFYAQLSTSGVGAWTETTDYGAASGTSGSGGVAGFLLSCVEWNSYVYCVGNGSGSSQVFYAPLLSTGVGPWKETIDYGASSGTSGKGGLAVASTSCAEENGTDYCVGGMVNSKATSYVFSTPLLSTGVGGWTQGTDYGASTGTMTGSGGLPIYGTTCVGQPNGITCIGGNTANGVTGQTYTIQLGPIESVNTPMLFSCLNVPPVSAASSNNYILQCRAGLEGNASSSQPISPLSFIQGTAGQNVSVLTTGNAKLPTIGANPATFGPGTYDIVFNYPITAEGIGTIPVGAFTSDTMGAGTGTFTVPSVKPQSYVITGSWNSLPSYPVKQYHDDCNTLLPASAYETNATLECTTAFSSGTYAVALGSTVTQTYPLTTVIPTPPTLTVSSGGTYTPSGCSTIGTLALSGTPTEVTIGTNKAVQSSFTNTSNCPVTAIVYAVVHNASGQTVSYFTSTITAIAGSSSTAYDVLFGLAPGTYSVTIFAVDTTGVVISTTSAVTVSI